jgi:hypothetical protein
MIEVSGPESGFRLDGGWFGELCVTKGVVPALAGMGDNCEIQYQCPACHAARVRREEPYPVNIDRRVNFQKEEA